MKKLTRLTDQQTAAMSVHAEAWIHRALEVRSANHEIAERGIRAHYELAGLPLPKAIIWTTSPIVLAFAGPIAAVVLELLRGKKPVHAVRSAVSSAVESAVSSAVDSVVESAVSSAVESAMESVVDSAVNSVVESAVSSVVESAVSSAVESAMESVVDSAVGSAVNSVVEGAVHSAVDSAVNSVVESAVSSAVESAMESVVDSAVGSAVNSVVEGAVHSAVDSAVNSVVESAVSSAVESAMESVVDSAVGSAVNSVVEGAVHSAVDSAVNSVVESAVSSAVESAVESAVKQLWSLYNGGALWSAWPAAWATFYRDHCGISLKAAQAAEDVTECYWWWPHREFVIVSERPTRLARDTAGRLHSGDGPAIQFADGWGVWVWHGTQIPREWIDDPTSLSPTAALSHRDIEQRRCACEILGWDKILESVPHRVLDRDPDPSIGTLFAVDLPDAPDTRYVQARCGTGRTIYYRAGRDSKTALEAAAASYQITPEQYLKLEVRT